MGFLSVVSFVFLDLGGGYARDSYVTTCYAAKLCFMHFSLCASLHLTKWYHFPRGCSGQKSWSHLDSSILHLISNLPRQLVSFTFKLHSESDPFSPPPGLRHLPSLTWTAFFFFSGCVGSSLLCAGFLQLWRAGATLCCSAQASHCSGFSCCGAQALGTRASVVAACWLSSCGSWALARRLSSCGARA